ncbi:uncharacterized protein PHALS_14586 [Plasmopara halstedii]|uniref:Uncharacterized protein n=1 Tax=Plasmopara halstedii TaxID=4781 RepID=A0A0P1AMF2_PLAHL|nr:uncharacterized protein PHALS_14586 [Plasmopara halstedii]CEG41962.1 hypothetical protein PHALS_14586 [Plasmopara halstedii]|eukprot:XP_024578331.1 hypothetical protein PHALS_14586 [Plasmopara halstedii]
MWRKITGHKITIRSKFFFTFSQHRRKSVYFEYDFLLSRDCIDRSPISTLLEGICCQIQTRGTYLWSDKQERTSGLINKNVYQTSKLVCHSTHVPD